MFAGAVEKIRNYKGAPIVYPGRGLLGALQLFLMLI